MYQHSLLLNFVASELNAMATQVTYSLPQTVGLTEHVITTSLWVSRCCETVSKRNILSTMKYYRVWWVHIRRSNKTVPCCCISIGVLLLNINCRKMCKYWRWFQTLYSNKLVQLFCHWYIRIPSAIRFVDLKTFCDFPLQRNISVLFGSKWMPLVPLESAVACGLQTNVGPSVK